VPLDLGQCSSKLVKVGVTSPSSKEEESGRLIRVSARASGSCMHGGISQIVDVGWPRFRRSVRLRVNWATQTVGRRQPAARQGSLPSRKLVGLDSWWGKATQIFDSSSAPASDLCSHVSPLAEGEIGSHDSNGSVYSSQAGTVEVAKRVRQSCLDIHR